MASKSNPTSRKEDIVVKELEGEVLIYDLRIHKAYCLNETSALVWQACDGNKSVSEISQQLSNVLNQPVNKNLVVLALDQLNKENLLSNGQGVESNFNGLSRREVIKKVGLGSMIALPVISSLVAPIAAHAQSLNCNHAGSAGDPMPCGCPCSLNTFCAGSCVCDLSVSPAVCV